MIDKELLIKRIRHDSDCWASTEEVYDLVKAVDNIVIWHPYPQEKPTENGIYIVTVFPKDKKFVSCSHYHDLLGWDHFADDMVLAWAELPKAYEP